MAKTHNPAARTSGQVTHECREVKPRTASGGNAVKNPKQAMALDPAKGGKTIFGVEKVFGIVRQHIKSLIQA